MTVSEGRESREGAYIHVSDFKYLAVQVDSRLHTLLDDGREHAKCLRTNVCVCVCGCVCVCVCVCVLRGVKGVDSWVWSTPSLVAPVLPYSLISNEVGLQRGKR